MEEIASFFILLIIYFLGCLAVVQLAIRPNKNIQLQAEEPAKPMRVYHLKILVVSFLLSLFTTTIAYLIFP